MPNEDRWDVFRKVRKMVKRGETAEAAHIAALEAEDHADDLPYVIAKAYKPLIAAAKSMLKFHEACDVVEGADARRKQVKLPGVLDS